MAGKVSKPAKRKQFPLAIAVQALESIVQLQPDCIVPYAERLRQIANRSEGGDGQSAQSSLGDGTRLQQVDHEDNQEGSPEGNHQGGGVDDHDDLEDDDIRQVTIRRMTTW